MTFFSYFRQHFIPNRSLIRSFLKRPLTWQGFFLLVLFCALLVSIYIGLITLNTHFLYPTPARGGTLTEGVIGAPHLINPILASTTTDQELVKLIYSGLLKETSTGEFVPDLAEQYEVSSDGRVYTFHLRDMLRFSNNKPLTSQDVAFTVRKRALFEANSFWQQVSVDTPDDHTIIFTLQAPDSDFLRYATIGIVPMSIWEAVPDESMETDPHNLDPIGSGPFRIRRVLQENGIVQAITLSRNARYVGPKPYLDRYKMLFYANQRDLRDALKSSAIDLTTSATPETAYNFEHNYTVDRLATQRLTALYESKNTALFSPATLEILNQSIDKASILATIEYGYGTLLDAKLLSVDEAKNALHMLGYSTSADGSLSKNGAPIRFSVAVENNTTTLAAASAFTSQMEALGIEVTLKAFDPGRFQDVIEQNQYQFFFGTVPERDIPQSYHAILPLYHTALPLIRDARVHIPNTRTLDRLTDWYTEHYNWYVRIDKVWNIFRT